MDSSLLYSDLSLRPPIPRRGRPDDKRVERGRATTAAAAAESEGNLEKNLVVVVPTPFLFRMYIACHVLRLDTETRFTALVLLHRYAMAKTLNEEEEEEDWPWIGAICLFLACKAENEPRRLRDIINMAQMILSVEPDKRRRRSSSSDNSPNPKSNALLIDMENTPPLDGAYWDMKKKAIETEQMVLRWLGFDCSVSHPHRAVYFVLEQFVVGVAVNKKASGNAVSEQDKQEIRSIASRRLNDALFYPKALQWGVVELACAALYLAALEQISKEAENAVDNNLKVFTSFGWWKRQFGVSNENFEDCWKDLEEATEFLKRFGNEKDEIIQGVMETSSIKL